MDSRYYVTLQKYLNDGDYALAYRQGGTFPAAIQFKGVTYFDETDIGWTKSGKPFIFPYRINFAILKESKNPPKIGYSTVDQHGKGNWVKPNFIDDVVFICDKGRSWNQYLQVSILSITEEDYNTVSSRIGEAG